jgi:hypothetical protein
MLHERPHNLEQLLQGTGERRLLPSAGVAANAESPGGCTPRGEPDAVVAYQRAPGAVGLLAPDDQVIAPGANVHALGGGVSSQQSLQLRFGILAACGIHCFSQLLTNGRPSNVHRNGLACCPFQVSMKRSIVFSSSSGVANSP